MAGKICMVIGVGPGIGMSVAKKWASQGYKVALISRSQDKLDNLAGEIGENAAGFAADCANEKEMVEAVAKVEQRFQGEVDTLVYNAGSGVFKTFEQLTLSEMETSMRTNVYGLLIASKLLAPKMIKNGGGVIAITGATASLRGKPFTAGFAPAKGAQRLLAQSLARDLFPKSIHVFLAIIDGMVYSPEAQSRNQSLPKERFMQPDAIADVYWQVANQHESCWSHEVDLRSNVSEW